MKPLYRIVFCAVILLSSCSITPSSLPTMTVTPQPVISSTPTPSRTPTPTISKTPTLIVTATRTPTGTQVIAQDLGITVSQIKEVFTQEGFKFSSPRTVKGMDVIKGLSQYGNRIEIYVKSGSLIYVEASVPNKGPQTNPSSLFLLLQTIVKKPDGLKSIEYWLDNVAPGAADASPKMEATYIDEKNVFYTFAHDKGYTRMYLKVYVLSWVTETQ